MLRSSVAMARTREEHAVRAHSVGTHLRITRNMPTVHTQASIPAKAMTYPSRWRENQPLATSNLAQVLRSDLRKPQRHRVGASMDLLTRTMYRQAMVRSRTQKALVQARSRIRAAITFFRSHTNKVCSLRAARARAEVRRMSTRIFRLTAGMAPSRARPTIFHNRHTRRRTRRRHHHPEVSKRMACGLQPRRIQP